MNLWKKVKFLKKKKKKIMKLEKNWKLMELYINYFLQLTLKKKYIKYIIKKNIKI